MFGIGLWELLAILLIVAVFFRPEDVPRILRKLGRFYGRVSSLSSGLLREIDAGRREAEAEERRNSESRDEHERGTP